MKRLIWSLLLVGGVAAGAPVVADTIYLKTGGIIEGKVYFNDGKKIKVKTAGRATLIFELSDVEKIVKDHRTGDDYLRRKSGVKGGKAHNPFGGGKGGEADVEEGENPYEDTTELTPEEQDDIDVQIRNLQRQDKRYRNRAKTRLTAMGYKAGRSVLKVLDSDMSASRQRAVEILRDINYKPATPRFIEKALSDESGFTRAAAIEALKRWTGKRFGYAPYDPLPMRQRTIANWQEWWREEEAKYVPEEPEEEGGEEGGDEEETPPAEEGGEGEEPPPVPPE